MRRGCLWILFEWFIILCLVTFLITLCVYIAIPILIIYAIYKFIKNRKEKHNVSETE